MKFLIRIRYNMLQWYLNLCTFFLSISSAAINFTQSQFLSSAVAASQKAFPRRGFLPRRCLHLWFLKKDWQICRPTHVCLSSVFDKYWHDVAGIDLCDGWKWEMRINKLERCCTFGEKIEFQQSSFQKRTNYQLSWVMREVDIYVKLRRNTRWYV